MKTPNYLFYVSLLFVLTMFIACNDDFSIGNDYVVLRVGETVTLEIKHASGKCNAEVLAPDIVSATVNDDGRLELFAKDEGSTTVRLTDGSNETIEIAVNSMVDLKGMWAIKGTGRPYIIATAYAQDADVAGNIWEILEKQVSVPVNKLCVFLRDDESDEALGNLFPLYYKFKNGQLTIEYEGEKCTYTILQWTEDELIIQEDLTEYFRSLYPNAGVTDVKRKINWARYYKPMGNVR